MPTGVRLARTTDIDDIAAIQVRAWEELYGSILGDAGLRLDRAELADQWGAAILDPPDQRARVLVATQEDLVVGFAAFGPSFDPDLAGASGEIHALVVHPDRLRQGHGSRLMAACVDHLRSAGFDAASTWTLLEDRQRRAFWQSAGWGPDSARRTLGEQAAPGMDPDAGASITEIRLVTSIAAQPQM